MIENLPIHPMLTEKRLIEERGLMVFDNVRQMPSYDEPISTTFMAVVLNMEGWMSADCDMKRVDFRKHDLAVVSSHHVLCAKETSSDYRAMMIIMSAPFQNLLKQRFPDIYRDNFHYLFHPDFHLNDNQFDTVYKLFLLIDEVSKTDNTRREEMLCSLLEVLFLLLQDYRIENDLQFHKLSVREEMFLKFYQAIESNYQKSHEVKFYADMLNLSPKYFASVIKSHTGINAIEWINKYVTIQAKIMLRHQRSLPIQQIAKNLGFIDQAAFSRFFKHNTGLSPSQFRE